MAEYTGESILNFRTMCYGRDCPKKDKCFRHRACAGPTSGYVDFDLQRNGECRWFWPFGSEAYVRPIKEKEPEQPKQAGQIALF